MEVSFSLMCRDCQTDPFQPIWSQIRRRCCSRLRHAWRRCKLSLVCKHKHKRNRLLLQEQLPQLLLPLLQRKAHALPAAQAVLAPCRIRRWRCRSNCRMGRLQCIHPHPCKPWQCSSNNSDCRQHRHCRACHLNYSRHHRLQGCKCHRHKLRYSFSSRWQRLPPLHSKACRSTRLSRICRLCRISRIKCK